VPSPQNASPPRRRGARPGPRPRTLTKRARIVEVAMRHFAEHGYKDARVDDMASDLGISKASIFQHFKTKEALFFAAYRRSAESLRSYLDVPEELRRQGFFPILRYWMEQTETNARERWIAWQVMVVGTYGTDLALRRQLNGYLAEQDPWGTRQFVELGLSRGELRTDLAPGLLASAIDWLMERFQDGILHAELYPRMFGGAEAAPLTTRQRIEQFIRLLEGAVGRNDHNR
jgi:AcrR family transcriptional regulator